MDDLDAANKLLPADRKMEADYGMKRFRILLGKKDYAAAYELGAKLSTANKDFAFMQNYMAWQIGGDNTIEKPDLDLAETMAHRAVKASKGKDPEILETQARVLFMKGKKEEAIKQQTKAVTLAKSGQKEAMQSTLDSYKMGQLPAPHALE